MDSEQIKVAIFNEHPRSGKELVKILGKAPDISVVAETGIAGINAVEEKKPDVILVDSKQPFTEGIETTERIVSSFQDTRIIFLSQDSSGGSMTVSECLVGACYPLSQDSTDKDILAAIREGHQPG
jgi:DNA-binding NarL/FixJ family response regulator